MTHVRLVLVVGLLLGSHSLAQAQAAVPPPSPSLEALSQRESLIERGLALRQQARDEEALACFQSAAEIRRDGRVVAQIAFAEQAMGRWGDSYRHLSEALADRDDAWIKDHASALDAELARIEANVGRLEVITNVAVTKLTVDGKEVGSTPLTEPLVVTAGAVVVSAQAPGYLSTTRRVPVHAGALSRTELVLVPEPAVVRNTVVINRTEERIRERRNEWLYVAGAGALVAISSVGTWVRSDNIMDDLKKNCSGPNSCGSHYQHDSDKIGRLDAATNGLLFGGIATAVVASSLYWLWPRSEQRTVQPSALITSSSFMLAARVTR